MARVVKSAAVRQDEILDVAQRLFMERGYDATPIQAIIDEIGIAKGTFYHHYPSKPALLDALVARIVEQSLAVAEPIVADPTLGAIDKLNALFLRVGAWKADRRALLTAMHQAMHAPSNLQLLIRTQRESIDAMVPLVQRVIDQGVAEGVFDTPYSDQAARLVLELGVTLGREIGDALAGAGPRRLSAAQMARSMMAWHDAVGRLLGAPPGAVGLVDVDLLLQWFEADERA